MKGLLRVYLFHLLALWLATQVFSQAFVVNGTIVAWLMGALILSLLNLLVKPILKLLFFPINALSLGLFSLVINSAVFFLFYKITPQVRIMNWNFLGLTTWGANLPAYEFGFWGTLFLIALFISIVTGIFSYLTK